MEQIVAHIFFKGYVPLSRRYIHPKWAREIHNTYHDTPYREVLRDTLYFQVLEPLQDSIEDAVKEYFL